MLSLPESKIVLGDNGRYLTIAPLHSVPPNSGSEHSARTCTVILYVHLAGSSTFRICAEYISAVAFFGDCSCTAWASALHT